MSEAPPKEPVEASVTGETPLDYMTGWRVQQAKSLIETGDMPLKQVITSLGYASEAAFRTAFKRRVGQTPGDYRSAMRSETSRR